MIQFARAFQKPFHLFLVAVYLIVFISAASHSHHSEANCIDHGLCIQTADCCDVQCHKQSDCSLCEFLQSSHSMAESAESLKFPIQKNEFAVSHQTSANQICFGDAPSRAPPVC